MNDAGAGGRVTTHVLDTATGCPAAGLAIDFFRIDGGARTLLTSVVTNSDGRCDAPLLASEAMRAGVYEILFHVGACLGRGETPPFLDEVPVRFGIADAGAHYHVPLLLSPFGYTTYRGS
jgi:5-hydroxyisourate hydrolase